jgi:hypothetical protein
MCKMISINTEIKDEQEEILLLNNSLMSLLIQYRFVINITQFDSHLL